MKCYPTASKSRLSQPSMPSSDRAVIFLRGVLGGIQLLMRIILILKNRQKNSFEISLSLPIADILTLYRKPCINNIYFQKKSDEMRQTGAGTEDDGPMDPVTAAVLDIIGKKSPILVGISKMVEKRKPANEDEVHLILLSCYLIYFHKK